MIAIYISRINVQRLTWCTEVFGNTLIDYIYISHQLTESNLPLYSLLQKIDRKRSQNLQHQLTESNPGRTEIYNNTHT